MAAGRWSDIKRSKLTPETIASIESEAKGEVVAMDLGALAGKRPTKTAPFWARHRAFRRFTARNAGDGRGAGRAPKSILARPRPWNGSDAEAASDRGSKAPALMTDK